MLNEIEQKFCLVDDANLVVFRVKELCIILHHQFYVQETKLFGNCCRFPPGIVFHTIRIPELTMAPFMTSRTCWTADLVIKTGYLSLWKQLVPSCMRSKDFAIEF